LPQITDEDYLKRLIEQRDFLRSELKEYEKGQVHFAYKMASTLRTIFHNTSSSTAILPALAERYGIHISFMGHPDQDFSRCIMYLGFVIGGLRPPQPPHRVEKPFDDYWNEIIYVEKPYRYTRKQLVLFAANKLGGAHVDPEIPENMLILTQGNVKLGSQTHPEELVLTRAVYDTGWHILQKLDSLIPELEKAIKPPH